MKFVKTDLEGAYIVEPDLRDDNRGFFARTFCVNEFEEAGLSSKFIQCNISFNKLKGTLRGLHYQLSPHSEVKLVRCTKGAIYDAIVDLRPQSPTFKKWTSVILSAENRKLFYVPEGFAHGFQALEDGTEIFYQVSNFYNSQSERGIRYNDPTFNIEWPLPISVISSKDQEHPHFKS